METVAVCETVPLEVVNLFKNAIREGDTFEMVELLQEHPILLNHPDPVGGTPLILAARMGQTDALECLLEFGADTEATAYANGSSILNLGSVDDELKFYLIERGARKGIERLLGEFLFRSNLEAVERIVKVLGEGCLDFFRSQPTEHWSLPVFNRLHPQRVQAQPVVQPTVRPVVQVQPTVRPVQPTVRPVQPTVRPVVQPTVQLQTEIQEKKPRKWHFGPDSFTAGNQYQYFIHDNGGQPFKVTCTNQSDSGVRVLVERNDVKNKFTVLDVIASEVFIGKDIRPDDEALPELMITSTGYHGRMSPEYWDAIKRIEQGTIDGVRTDHDGNTILLHLPRKTSDGKLNTYILIGNSGIQEFKTERPIVSYASPIGNNDVPYPYAIDDMGYYYFMMDGLVVHGSQVTDKDSPFPEAPNGDMTGFHNISELYLGQDVEHLGQFHWYFHIDMADHYDRLSLGGGKVLVKQAGQLREITKEEYVNILQEWATEKQLSSITFKELAPRFVDEGGVSPPP